MGSAGLTQATLSQVNPLDGMRGRHDAAVVLAMAEIESVAQLVNGFFEQALAEQGIVAFEAIEFLAQAVSGNNGARPGHLGFSENVFQDGDVEIDVGHREPTPIPWAHQHLHAVQKFGGMILLALGMIGRSRIEPDRDNLTSNGETLWNCGAQVP